MVKFTNIIVICLCLFSINTYANEEIDKLTLPILESIHKGEINNLFSMAFPEGGSGYKYISESDIEKSNVKYQSSLKKLGKSNGYFEYLQSGIPDVFIIKYYVIKFERQPVLFKFRLYKQNDKWRINAIALDTKINDYLEEAAKIRMGSLGDQDFREKIKVN